MTLYANTSTHGASAGGKPHASESFETTPFRPRTQEPLALIRAVKNQQETLLEASQKHRGKRVPTADRLDATKTFPNSHAPPLISRSSSPAIAAHISDFRKPHTTGTRYYLSKRECAHLTARTGDPQQAKLSSTSTTVCKASPAGRLTRRLLVRKKIRGEDSQLHVEQI